MRMYYGRIDIYDVCIANDRSTETGVLTFVWTKKKAENLNRASSLDNARHEP